MVLDVETSSLRAVAVDMAAVAETISAVAGDVGVLGGVVDASVGAGVDALRVAWGAALGVLAEDVRYVSRRVGDAAELYDATDGGLARGMREPR